MIPARPEGRTDRCTGAEPSSAHGDTKSPSIASGRCKGGSTEAGRSFGMAMAETENDSMVCLVAKGLSDLFKKGKDFKTLSVCSFSL